MSADGIGHVKLIQWHPLAPKFDDVRLKTEQRLMSAGGSGCIHSVLTLQKMEYSSKFLKDTTSGTIL